MRQCPFIIVILSGVLALSCSKQQPASRDTNLTVRVDSVMRDADGFSGVIMIADNGSPVYYKAFGFRNYITEEAMDTASIFELASLSKQFTAMMVMMAKQGGLLSYDDPLEKFIPGLPYPGITIRHLLNHTSGLPDYQAVMDAHWDKRKVASNEDNISFLKKYHPERRFAPGEKYEYSNTGYMLLASVFEKASGDDFIDAMREKIFRPLQMRSTDIRTNAEKRLISSMAWGHLYDQATGSYVPADSFPQFNYAIWLGNRKGPGRVSSSAGDLLKWDRALYDTGLVSAATLKEAFTPAILNNGTQVQYGFGWELRTDNQRGRVVQHSGDNPGYNTWIARYLQPRKTLIILCNNGHPKTDEVFDALTGLIESDLRPQDLND